MSFTCPHCGQPHESGTTVCPASSETISPGYQWVGRTIAEKYEILSLLGEGGMGAVYMAKHTAVGKRFAIKLLHEQFVHHTEMVARFMREARAAGEVGHDNIIEVYDIGKEPSGSVYMVMEVLEGYSLEDVVHACPIPPPLATYILLQVLSVLEAAHAHGIVHRDMKPDNVFLTTMAGQPNYVKVLDFGIAKIKDAEGGHGLTQTGTMMGTPYYMSPEQARGAKDIDHRTDLYACGVMFYQMLTGKFPFEAPNIPALLVKITCEDPVPVQQIDPQIPAELATSIEKAMAKEVDVRFQTAAEFGEAIRAFAAQDVALQGLAAAKPAFDTGAPVTGAGQTTPMGWTDTGETVERPRRTGLVVGLIVAILLLAGAATFGGLVVTGVISGKAPSVDVQTTQPPPEIGAETEAVETVEFKVVADPQEAVITLDGVKLEGNPVSLEMDRSTSSKLLRITAEGFEEYKGWIKLDTDFTRTITLEPVASVDGGSKKGGKKKGGKKGKGETKGEPPAVQPEPETKPKKGGKTKGAIDEDNPYK
ncbi:MAG: serine/threonine protein kinase [Deltaproteobacteria bacterium]|nr:serine/threonine protein kinase [Deltaproteobacteria bacterium]